MRYKIYTQGGFIRIINPEDQNDIGILLKDPDIRIGKGNTFSLTQAGKIKADFVGKYESVLDRDGNGFKDAEECLTYLTNQISLIGLITPQSPLSSNLDVIYEKDIDWKNSDFLGWEGDPRDLFRNVNESKGIFNDSIEAIKYFTLRLIRSRRGRSFGIGTGVGNFSNVRAVFLGSGDVERGLLNFSEDNHKRNSLIYGAEEFVFNTIRVEFYTTDRIDVTNIFIEHTKSDRKQDYILKFGINPDVDALQREAIWPLGDRYIFTTIPQDYFISSSNVDDISVIRGEVIVINNEGRYQRDIYEVQLNGNTPVKIPTTNNYLCIASNRAFNNSSSALQGNVYIYENTPVSGGIPIDLGKVRSYIRIYKEQTEQAIYTVPEFLEDGRQVLLAELYRWSGELMNKQAVSGLLSLYVAPKDKVPRVQGNLGLSASVASKYDFGENTPLEIQGGSDIYIEASDLTANDVQIQASFVLRLVTS